MTGSKGGTPLRFLDELEQRGIPTWIRHVVVPGLTDNEEDLESLARYISSYQVIQKVELLPYHTMGAFKYQQLGISYPLEGVEPLNRMALQRAKEIFAPYKPVL